MTAYSIYSVIRFVISGVLALFTTGLLFNSRFRKCHKEGDPVCVFVVAALATALGVSLSLSLDRALHEKGERASLALLLSAADEDLEGRVLDLARFHVQGEKTSGLTPDEVYGKEGRVVDHVLIDDAFVRFVPAEGVRELRRTVSRLDHVLGTAASGLADPTLRDTTVCLAAKLIYEAHGMIDAEITYVEGKSGVDELLQDIQAARSVSAHQWYAFYWALLKGEVTEHAHEPELSDITVSVPHWDKPLDRIKR